MIKWLSMMLVLAMTKTSDTHRMIGLVAQIFIPETEPKGELEYHE